MTLSEGELIISTGKEQSPTLNVTKKVSIFNETILNVLCSYDPHDTLICDDRDPPHSLILELNLIKTVDTNIKLLSTLKNLQEQLIRLD